ncbi:hypothetical protein SNEBB_010527 [Seison nebaliae]|nr:hypothetical protein SNEBB_010527 [Seison nebaliae]
MTNQSNFNNDDDSRSMRAKTPMKNKDSLKTRNRLTNGNTSSTMCLNSYNQEHDEFGRALRHGQFCNVMTSRASEIPTCSTKTPRHRTSTNKYGTNGYSNDEPSHRRSSVRYVGDGDKEILETLVKTVSSNNVTAHRFRMNSNANENRTMNGTYMNGAPRKVRPASTAKSLRRTLKSGLSPEELKVVMQTALAAAKQASLKQVASNANDAAIET